MLTAQRSKSSTWWTVKLGSLAAILLLTVVFAPQEAPKQRSLQSASFSTGRVLLSLEDGESTLALQPEQVSSFAESSVPSMQNIKTGVSYVSQNEIGELTRFVEVRKESVSVASSASVAAEPEKKSAAHTTSTGPALMEPHHIIGEEECSEHWKGCEYVKEHCPNDISIVNWVEFHYCSMSHYPALSVILMVLLVMTCFYMLGDTAESFFSPALAKLGHVCRMTPSIAGVTFLAFGNGAPDCFASIVSFAGGNESIGLGAILGGGLFLICFVLAMVSWKSEPTVNLKSFYRDVVCYLLTALTFFWICFDGHVYLWESLLAIAIYFVYVFCVIIDHLLRQRRIKKAQEEHPNAQVVSNPASERVFDTTTASEFFSLSIDSKIRNRMKRRESVKDPRNPMDRRQSGPTNYPGLVGEVYCSVFESAIANGTSKFASQPPVGSAYLSNAEGKGKEPLMHHDGLVNDHRDIEEESHKAQMTSVCLPAGAVIAGDKIHMPNGYATAWQHPSQLKPMFQDAPYWEQIAQNRTGVSSYWHEFLEEAGERSFLNRLLFIVVLHPLTVLRKLTIPSIMIESYNKLYVCFSFTVSPVFFLFACGLLRFDGYWPILFVAFMLVGIACTIASLMTFSWQRPPTNAFIQGALALWAFTMSVVWIYTIATELVEVLSALGKLAGISPSIMGLSIVAWGNCVSDLLANLAIAEKGNGGMSITGCYAGPMFNMLIGLGVSFLISTNRAYPNPTNVPYDPNIPVCFLFLFLSLFSALIWITLTGGKFTRAFAAYQVIIYAICVILNILIESGVVVFHLWGNPALRAA
eukprot:GILI01002773.1.p2 GENE.GILI01002773.1~~GILI01002773.1.p2  ORF type:complete len:809 (+),score=281.64 GILI01002773.1:64-2490(+)